MLRQSQHERKLINNSKRPPVAPVKQPARLRQLRLSSRPVLNWEKGVKPSRPSERSLVQKFKRFAFRLGRNFIGAWLEIISTPR